jgi:hypothetical protein
MNHFAGWINHQEQDAIDYLLSPIPPEPAFRRDRHRRDDVYRGFGAQKPKM